MTDLSECLGHLLCEVTRACVMADMEALRVAHEYANDKNGLMKYFPVPRMRLTNLEVVLPVEIQDIPDSYIEKTNADSHLLAKILAGDLESLLKKQGLHISTAEITKIIKNNPRLSQGQLYEGLADELSVKFNDQVLASARKKKTNSILSETKAGEAFKNIESSIREQINKTISELPRSPVGISIEPRTASLREVGNPMLLLNIKLLINEDAMEIQIADEEKEVMENQLNLIPSTKTARIKRLVPE